MMMIVDVGEAIVEFDRINGFLKDLGEKIGVEIKMQLVEIFEAMHQI